jgi:hypothetical protein
VTVAVTDFTTGGYQAARQYTGYDKGTSLSEVARNIVSTFDHNRDGVVDMSGWEKFRLAGVGGQQGGVVGVFSGEQLLNAADKLGQRDGKVTTHELTALARRYDTGGWGGVGARDGSLNSVEYLRALSQIGPKLVWFIGGGQ